MEDRERWNDERSGRFGGDNDRERFSRGEQYYRGMNRGRDERDRDYQRGSRYGGGYGDQGRYGAGRGGYGEQGDYGRGDYGYQGGRRDRFGERDQSYGAGRGGHGGQGGYGGDDYGYQGGQYGDRDQGYGAQGGQQSGGGRPIGLAYVETVTWRSSRGGPFEGVGPKNFERSDDRIEEDISDRLAQDGDLDASEIMVQISKGEVTLSGEVDSRQDKRHAEDIAESCSGVKHVQNNLRVRDRDDSDDRYKAPGWGRRLSSKDDDKREETQRNN